MTTDVDPFAIPLRWPDLEARAQFFASMLGYASDDDARWHIADLWAAGLNLSVLRRAEWLRFGGDI